MSPADLICHVGAVAARRAAPRAAAAALAPLLAAFVAEPCNRRVPHRLCGGAGVPRILLNHPDDGFQIVVVPWPRGSSSPIHDHAGTVGAVAALAGATLETRYRVVADEAAGVRLAVHGCTRLCGGRVVPLLPEDGQQLHEMAHAQGDPAATVHVYLRPLVEFHDYEPMADGRHRRRTHRLWVDEVEGWRAWPAMREAEAA